MLIFDANPMLPEFPVSEFDHGLGSQFFFAIASTVRTPGLENATVMSHPHPSTSLHLRLREALHFAFLKVNRRFTARLCGYAS